MTNSKKPKVTVCIPTYGRAHLLQHVVQSVLNQSYTDFDLFISDDASPDNTEGVVKGFADPRIRYNRNENNLGLIPNWNFTIRHAQGEYVFKLDDDDYIHPAFLERTIGLLEKYPNVGSVYSGFFYAKDYEGGWIKKVIDRGTFNQDYIRGMDYIKSYLLHTSIPGIHQSAVVFKYDLAAEIGFYDKARNDVTFSLALASLADVGYIHEPLFYYVQHDDARATYGKGRDVRAADFDPTRIIKGFFDIDFIKRNPEIMKIKGRVLQKEQTVRSVLHLFLIRQEYGLREHAKVAIKMIKKDKKLLLSPLFLMCLAVTLLIPSKGAERLIYMYKSKSIFGVINSLLFSRK